MIKDMRLKVGAGLIAAVLATLGACTTATPYQPYRPESIGGVHGGYSEQRVAPDRFVVRFHGNELTSRDRVEGYMLYRAADLTLQNGYDSFEIVDRHTEHDVETYASPDPFYRPWYGPDYGWWRPEWRYYYPGSGWGRWGPFGYGGMDVRQIESFEAQAEILMRHGGDPARRTFDARQVMANLGPTIELPKR